MIVIWQVKWPIWLQALSCLNHYTVSCVTDQCLSLILHGAYMQKHVCWRKKCTKFSQRLALWIFLPHCPHYKVKISKWSAVIVIRLKRCASTRGIEWWSYKCPRTKIYSLNMQKTVVKVQNRHCACAVATICSFSQFSGGNFCPRTFLRPPFDSSRRGASFKANYNYCRPFWNFDLIMGAMRQKNS